MRILGYRPYHGAEVIGNGIPHIEIFTEALNAKYFGIGKPYGKQEFDKWFAEYDVRTALDFSWHQQSPRRPLSSIPSLQLTPWGT